jgi:hypothetical protein
MSGSARRNGSRNCSSLLTGAADTLYCQDPAPAAADSSRLVRSPTTVMRTERVSCVVTAPGWEVFLWEFVEDSSSISPGRPQMRVREYSTNTEWAGPVLAGGIVTVHVTRKDSSRTYTSRFTVTPRPSPSGPGLVSVAVLACAGPKRYRDRDRGPRAAGMPGPSRAGDPAAPQLAITRTLAGLLAPRSRAGRDRRPGLLASHGHGWRPYRRGCQR